MRIVSLNAWGGALFDALSEWLPDCGADVLCLQEVTRTSGLGGWTRFDDGERSLPQRANLFADICTALPCHQGIFLASDSGPVFDEHGVRYQQDFGIAMFIHEQYPVIGSMTAFVHGSYIDHAEWTIADRPRIAHASRIVDRTSNRIVSVTHMHGLRDPAGKGDSPARHTQAEHFADLITRASLEGDFVVACGDFNLLPDSKTFRVLDNNCGLVDLVGTSDTRTSKYMKPNRHANYMLVSNPESIIGFATPSEPEVSDHRFLVLDI